jgi:hypothetical protein
VAHLIKRLYEVGSARRPGLKEQGERQGQQQQQQQQEGQQQQQQQQQQGQQQQDAGVGTGGASSSAAGWQPPGEEQQGQAAPAAPALGPWEHHQKVVSELMGTAGGGSAPRGGQRGLAKSIVYSSFWMHLQLIASQLQAAGIRCAPCTAPLHQLPLRCPCPEPPCAAQGLPIGAAGGPRRQAPAPLPGCPWRGWGGGPRGSSRQRCVHSDLTHP